MKLAVPAHLSPLIQIFGELAQRLRTRPRPGASWEAYPQATAQTGRQLAPWLTTDGAAFFSPELAKASPDAQGVSAPPVSLRHQCRGACTGRIPAVDATSLDNLWRAMTMGPRLELDFFPGEARGVFVELTPTRAMIEVPFIAPQPIDDEAGVPAAIAAWLIALHELGHAVAWQTGQRAWMAIDEGLAITASRALLQPLWIAHHWALCMPAAEALAAQAAARVARLQHDARLLARVEWAALNGTLATHWGTLSETQRSRLGAAVPAILHDTPGAALNYALAFAIVDAS